MLLSNRWSAKRKSVLLTLLSHNCSADMARSRSVFFRCRNREPNIHPPKLSCLGLTGWYLNMARRLTTETGKGIEHQGTTEYVSTLLCTTQC